MKVVIIGAGIGGLICAIACRQENLEVTVLERASELIPVGAGIQIPPNAARVARRLGILQQLIEKSVVLDSIEYLRYANGKLVFRIEGGKNMVEKFGDKWMVIARPDYHQVLWDAAKDAGVELRLGAEVGGIDFDTTSARLKGGEIVKADVIVGADGLWSHSRDQLLGTESPPSETGDLAYRGTIAREQLLGLGDPRIDELINDQSVKCWMGPGRHCVFYPLAGGKSFNLVLIRPDNLSKDVRQAPGEIGEMRACFEGWDERLTKIISCIPSVLKWKLCHHEELESWTKNAVVLLGDACHPTLPYQAQGAAMAAEDGAVLGKLLGLLDKSGLHDTGSKRQMEQMLQLYESLRKTRTTTNVQGAASNQISYHLPDGPLQKARDATLSNSGGNNSGSGYHFADWDYLRSMLSFDCVDESIKAFEKWSVEQTPSSGGSKTSTRL